MNTKYRIGIFVALLLFVVILGAGYQISYKYLVAEQEKQEQLKEQQFLKTKGEAEKNEGFYLCVLHGYIAVYLHDQATLYELTNIAVSTLPEEVQGELRGGKYIETEQELYAFLENYSS